MAFSGTIVAAGRGVGVVTATGAATEIGRINKMIADVEKLAACRWASQRARSC